MDRNGYGMKTTILKLATLRRQGFRLFPWTGHGNGNAIECSARSYRMPTGPNRLEGHYLPMRFVNKGTLRAKRMARAKIKRLFWERFALLHNYEAAP